MNKEQAVSYLRFSGFSDEQIKAIEGAFTWELTECLTDRPCDVLWVSTIGIIALIAVQRWQKVRIRNERLDRKSEIHIYNFGCI